MDCAGGLNAYSETHGQMQDNELHTTYECCYSVHSSSSHMPWIRRQQKVAGSLPGHDKMYMLCFCVILQGHTCRCEWINLVKLLSLGSQKYICFWNDKTLLKSWENHLRLEVLTEIDIEIKVF